VEGSLQMVKVRQRFPRPVVSDIPGEVRAALRRLDISARVNPGAKIAIPVGSRGIANIALILKEAVDYL